MFVIKEIHLPRINQIIAVDKLEKPFEEAIKQALFTFPYKPDYYYYVVCVREENGVDDFLLIVEPDTRPAQNQLFVSVIDNVPVVKKYDSEIHDDLKILGTVAHASRSATIHID